MKNLFVILFFSLCAFSTQAQDITGSWKGTMVQDSPRRAINFELAIKEKDGKFFGYCYRLFIVNDSLIYNTVKIEARITDSVLIIEDEQSVSKNFEEKANKIKVVYFFKLNKKTDDPNSLSGEWTTNRYKKYMAITGTVQIYKEQDFTTTQLFKRLEEKKLHKEMTFDVKTNASSIAGLTRPQTQTPEKPVDTIQTIAGKTGNETKQQNSQPSVATNNPQQNLPTAPVVNKPTVLPAKDSSKVIAGKIGNETKQQNNQPSVAANSPQQNLPTAPAVNKPTIMPAKDSSKVIAGKIGNETKQQNNQPSVTANNPQQNLPTAPVVNKPTVIPAKDSSNVIAGKIGNETKQQNNQPSIAANNPQQNLPTAPVVNKPTVIPAKDSSKVVAVNQNKPQVTTQNKPAVTSPVPEKTKEQTVKTDTKPVVQKPATVPVVTQPSAVVITEKPLVDINKANESTNTTAVNKPYVPAPLPVISNPTIVKRVTEIIQTIDIAEDSVVLSLYDNGEIDGDTVSVFVNNELIVSKVGLSAKAFKKTIYFKQGETIQLTFFAENLGSIPPNTGLLVIYSSTERHQIFFSSNYDKSSSILLRRKE